MRGGGGGGGRERGGSWVGYDHRGWVEREIGSKEMVGGGGGGGLKK